MPTMEDEEENSLQAALRAEVLLWTRLPTKAHEVDNMHNMVANRRFWLFNISEVEQNEWN